jgi:Vitamin K-dependent gamma-carboxylase
MSSNTRKIRDFYFTIDPRSLALFRILIGGLLIEDWLARWSHIETFYTSFGVLRTNLLQPLNHHFLLLHYVDSLRGVQLVFLFGLLCYVLFTIGYRTRLMTFLSLVFFASIVGRNIMVRHGGDTVMATMLAWSVFLPLGKSFSMDAIARKKRMSVYPHSQSTTATDDEVKQRSPISFAECAVICQIGLIYLVTAITKYGLNWKEGTALYYVLNTDQFAYPLGAWLATNPLWILKALTWGTLALEFAILPLLLLPFAQPYLRRIAIIGTTGMHLLIWLLMNIGDFPLVMISLNALLLRAEDWQLLTQHVPVSILKRYSKAVNWLTRRKLLRRRPKTEAPGVERSSSEGVVNVAPAANAWGQVGRLISNWLVVLMFAWVLISSYNLNVARRFQLKTIEELSQLDKILSSLQMDQDWHLFAPDPMKDDGWWVIDGISESGQHIDPLTREAPRWDKQDNLAGRYDRYWRKYLYRLWKTRDAENLRIFADYITRKDRREHPPGQQLLRFDFYYVLETTQPPGSPKPFPTQRVLLWSSSGQV